MNPQIEIRRTCGKDAAQMLAFLKKLGGESDNLTFGAEGIPFTEEDEASLLDKYYHSECGAIFAAFDGEQIIGDVSFDGSTRERLRHRGSVAVGVLRDYWHRGIGSELLKTALDFAKNTVHAEIVSLEVRVDNERAIHLYERFGFVKTGTIPALLKIDGKWIDVYTMTKIL